ncbi:hypothetical protein DFR70_12724 [Nocardia tenerifensis]|uniref:Uncharacterized protein n=1 Tax=Nocardia tenerifensis TaxID=228006 RepID=A0A318JKT2_9NOCA|nr:hypothetical protein DFR70_12724 [Nocardia tenerifensis]
MTVFSPAARLVVRIAVIVTGFLSLSASAAAAAEPLLDLRALTVDSTEVSTDEFRFQPSSERRFDAAAALPSDDPLSLYVQDNTRQGWDRYFTAGTTELHIRMIEFTSNRWAETLRGSGEPTPGYSPGTRVRMRDENGRHTLFANAVRGRVEVIVFLTTTLPSAAGEPEHPDSILQRAISAQLGKLPDSADLSDNRSAVGTWLTSAVTYAISMPLLALLLLGYVNLRDTALLERISNRRVFAEPVPSVPIRDISEEAARLRRHARIRCAALAGVTAVLGTLAIIGQLALFRSIVLLYVTTPVIVTVVLLADIALRGYRARRRPSKGAFLMAMAGTAGAMVVVAVCTVLLAVSLWLLVLGRPLYLIAAPVLLFLLQRAIRYIDRPLRWTKAVAVLQAAVRMEADDRPPVLLFRSSLDAARQIRTHRCAIADPAEAAATLPFERFESVLTWALWQFGPVHAGVDPDNHPPEADIAREFHSRDDWRAAVRSIDPAPVLTVVIVGRSPGSDDELRTMATLGQLGQCLLVIPPIPEDEVWDRLVLLASATGTAAELLRAAAAHTRAVLGVYFGPDGRPVLVAADRRDDHTYRAMVAQVGAELVGRAKGRLHTPASESRRSQDTDLRRWLVSGSMPRTVRPMNIKRAAWHALTQLRWAGRNRDNDLEMLDHTRARVRDHVRNGEYGAVYDQYLTRESRSAISRSHWIEQSRAAYAEDSPATEDQRGAVAILGNTALLTIVPNQRQPILTLTYRRHRSGQWQIDLTDSDQ